MPRSPTLRGLSKAGPHAGRKDLGTDLCSWSSPVRSKSARDESARHEPEDTIAKRAEAERKRREVFTRRQVQFHQGADLHSVKDTFSVAEARQREGWAPKTPAPSAEQKDGQVWYNWRTSRGTKRLPIVDYKRNLLLHDWLRIDRTILRNQSELIQSELYCITVMLMYHQGFINIPAFIGSSYRHPSHTANGALERLRWLIPGVVPYLGSNPEETIRQRYRAQGLPLHLQPYTKNVTRTASKPKGERMIDHRLQITSSSNTTKLQVISSGTGSAPDLRAKLSIKTSGSSAAKETEETVNIEVNSLEPTPADTDKVIDTPEVVPVEEEEAKEKVNAADAVYAYKDVRQKQWDKQRELIISALKLFQRDRASNAGSRELRKYLRGKLVNKLARKSLLPDKLARISDADMEDIISRTSGLTTHALEAFVPLPRANLVDSDSEQSDDEPYIEGMDKEDDDEDGMVESSDSLLIHVSEDQEFHTPPRMCNNNAPVDKRKDSGCTSPPRRDSRESRKKTVMRKPSYQSGHIQYSKTKYRKTSDKTRRPRSRSRSSSPRRSSPHRGSSSTKKRDHKRRGEGK